MGAEAKLYLQEHRIPQLFEGLMTGLIYNRPPDPISFLEQSLHHIKTHPNDELTWDMFIEKGMTSSDRKSIASKRVTRPISKNPKSPETAESRRVSRESQESREKTGSSGMGLVRTPSVTKAAQVADIPHVPIILFMGGPGGGKTRHAAKVASSLSEQGLVHICMPDIIRQALARYKDKYPEWREANEHYMRGELIPNHLALSLVKAEMGRHKNATAFFLEGFPREARQVEDFERQVKNVNMALIIDYDEKTLRDHMEKRGLGMEIIDQKIKEFKQKTLPSAKYFDDQKLLHLIPGERDDHTIYERMRALVTKAMETGVPVINSNPPSQQTQRPMESPPSEAVTVTNQSPSDPKANTDELPIQTSNSERVPVVNTVLSIQQTNPEVSLEVRCPVSDNVNRIPVSFALDERTSLAPTEQPFELSKSSESRLEPQQESQSTVKKDPKDQDASLSSKDTKLVPTANGRDGLTNVVPKRDNQHVSTDSSPLEAMGTVQFTSRDSKVGPEIVQAESIRQVTNHLESQSGKSDENLSNGGSQAGTIEPPINAPHSASISTNASTNPTKLSGPTTVGIVQSMSVSVSSPVQLEKPRTPPVAVATSQPPPFLPVRESTPPKIIGPEEPVPEVPPIPTVGPLPEVPSEVRVIPPTAEPPNTIVTTATIHNSRPASQQSRKSTAEGPRTATPKRNGTPKDPPRTTSSQYSTAEVPSGLPNNAPVIMLVGAPGALKNDVARRITQKYDGFVLVSMGDLLRKSVSESPDDELWKRINTKIMEGEPVPTKLCRQLLYNEIHTVGQGAWGYVIEGYPRTISQLDDFEGVVARVDVAILIDCTEQFCEEMVKKRFEESGHRKDDSPEVFKVRLATFKQDTLPMLKHLDERGKLRVVDGDGDADTVFKEVSQVIDGALFIEEDDGSGGSLDESKKSLRTQQQQQQAV